MARTLVKTLAPQIEYSSMALTDGAVSSGSFIDIPNTPTLTFVAAATAVYKVYANVALNKTGGGNAFIIVTNTVGGAVALLDQTATQLDIDTDDWINGTPFSLFSLVAGVTYTFVLQARVTTGSIDILFSEVHSALVAEQKT